MIITSYPHMEITYKCLLLNSLWCLFYVFADVLCFYRAVKYLTLIMIIKVFNKLSTFYKHEGSYRNTLILHHF
jgi:hypothetical protein